MTKVDQVTVIDPLPGMEAALRVALADRGIANAVEPPIDGLIGWLNVPSNVVVVTVDDMVGRSLLHALSSEGLGQQVLALVDSFDAPRILEALDLGVRMVAARNAPPDAIVETLLRAFDGEALLPLGVFESIVRRTRRETELAVGHVEIEWLRELAAGCTTHQLASGAGHSERAMFRLLHDLYGRLGASNRQQALIIATRAGLLDDEAANT